MKLTDIIDISYITNKLEDCFKKQQISKTNFDETLKGLTSFLTVMKPKSYSFITDGIEAKNNIKEMGLSDSRMKKLNKVSVMCSNLILRTKHFLMMKTMVF